MKEYFPIGTTISIKGIEDVLFVITGLAVENQKKEYRDYVAIRYPVGTLGDDHYFFFDHTDINEVVHMGYMNADHESYVNLINAVKESGLEER